jgi:hypothetical protein
LRHWFVYNRPRRYPSSQSPECVCNYKISCQGRVHMCSLYAFVDLSRNSTLLVSYAIYTSAGDVRELGTTNSIICRQHRGLRAWSGMVSISNDEQIVLWSRMNSFSVPVHAPNAIFVTLSWLCIIPQGSALTTVRDAFATADTLRVIIAMQVSAIQGWQYGPLPFCH